MLLIDWNDHFSVGIPSIDEQHKKLVNMINALHAAIEQDQGEDALNDIFDGLAVYIEKHFSYEEGLFAEHGFPDEEAHRREHEILTEQVETLRKRFEAEEGMITVALLEFLKNWLQNHILDSDKRYSSFLQEKGVE